MAGGETQEVFSSIRTNLSLNTILNGIKTDLNFFLALDFDVQKITFLKRSGKLMGKKSFRKYLIYRKGFRFAKLLYTKHESKYS